ncbi:beta-glucosidase [Microbispora sp. NEAU-D428]|uniref:GH1 family beta-glucosidase n=1 Tax=Microbispora sitophila TaxID=2771537 RepID=UPI001866D533|nr:GH1 family beta-glucosidase [Microbispora sitophila]MBE3014736.1 beta-glucosidase [Microbispora sitophila]
MEPQRGHAPDVTAFDDFVWGVATSAYQIEGAALEDGRLPSIWDTFCEVPGAIDGGDTGEVACDHYHRWREDVGLLERLGVDAYRFSVAWPRVVPDGTGPVNPRGLAFYDRLVDALLDAGIRPFATLYHWDLPQALQDRGGWPARDTAQRFADYAAVVAERLGDRVADWTTLNEPLCCSWHGHLEGSMAPGVKDLEAAVRTSYHLHLAHGLATQAVRAAARLTPSIGIVNNLSPCDPATDSEEDHAAARRLDGHVNRWWLDPVTGRGYPEDMIAVYGVDLPIRPGDLETIAAPLDYLGVNYYFRQVVAADPDGPVPYARQVEVPGATTTAMGWEVDAGGLERLLVRLAREYAAPRLYVTESGSAWPDTVGADGTVDDPERLAYLEDHIAACGRAIEQGAPVAGYFAWSLLDNFEWAYGYDKRFGLVHVDYETQARTVKSSGHRYAEIIKASKRLRVA